ncbi:MAG TPA: T9SS type A sorting domain-containing protein [Bacteroidia bacterium]|nr:T9SS type A sorting domain-containing protein [Bacteroidia bacterium]
MVYNGYFEIHDTCPNGTSSYPNNMQINYVNGWHAAALTPDYFDTCATMGNAANVPYAELGYQKDCCGGGGYIGEYMFDNNATNNDDREYIYTKLIDTLKAGHKYVGSMYVSRANFNYSIVTTGMLFTNTATALTWPQGFISANPQVKSTTLLADTMNWMLVQDTFIAVGTEAYLTIGNFNTNVTSGAVMSSGAWWYSNAAYYYIDGVSVYDVATMGIEQNKNKVGVSVYPNPATNKINIACSLQIIAFNLYDVLGNKILSTKQNELDVSNLPNGVYFVQVQTITNSFTQKIIVQH